METMKGAENEKEQGNVESADEIVKKLMDVMAEAKKYEDEHGPPPEIPDNVLGAMERPEVNGARMAFLDYVAEVTGGQLFPTNYYDQVLAGAVRSLRRSGRFDQGVADRLLHLYCAFVESLLPFQPSAEAVQASKNRPALPWNAPPPNAGDVFYFIPSSGGYWIKGCKAAAEICGTRMRANTNTNTNNSRRIDLNRLFQIFMVVIVFVVLAYIWWRE